MKKAEADIETFKRILKESGIRVTHQRLEIYKEIKEATDHPTVEVLYERLKTRLPTVSLDTIYRTLVLFVELGLIKRVFGKGPVQRYDPNTYMHHHLVCKECGTIIDFDWPDLVQVSLPETIKDLGSVENMQVQVIGICERCKKGGKEKL